MKKLQIYTIGHSTHSIDKFIELLKHYGITEIVDIRTIPKSRYNPQFNGPDLAQVLRNHHIGYVHKKGLGGLRHARPDSINTAWRNASFRGFTDYMQTTEFTEALAWLIELADKKIVAIMCSEAVPWRCHRSLIGDALLIHDVNVEDIYSLTQSKPHRLTAWSSVSGTAITYPASALVKSNKKEKNMNNHEQHDPITIKNYLPLILVFTAIIIATIIKQSIDGYTLKGALSDFMGFFFIIFGLLKALNLRGFVDSYRSYDLIARKSKAYAHLYPFIEIALGTAFLMRFAPVPTTVIATILMAINSIGVIRALRERQDITCACLGTFLNVPLTYVSLFEDVLMLAMGVIMLLIH